MIINSQGQEVLPYEARFPWWVFYSDWTEYDIWYGVMIGKIHLVWFERNDRGSKDQYAQRTLGLDGVDVPYHRDLLTFKDPVAPLTDHQLQYFRRRSWA